MRPLLALVLAAHAAVALANERIPVDHVRFSGDSSRVMVLTSGLRDGSGLGTAQLRVFSTSSGAALYTRQQTADAAPNTLRWNLLTQPPAPTRLAAFGLLPGVASSAKYNRVYPQPYPQWSDGLGAGQTGVTPVNLWSGPVPVTLRVDALPSSCPYPDMLPPGDVPAGFSLTVNTQTIHLDTALPPERRCAARYSLERVDVRGNRVLVTVRAYGPGFEGPDATAVFVAATLH
jgi:predicted secreted protein